MANRMPPPQYEKHQQQPNLPPYPAHDQEPIYPPIPQMQQPIHHHTNIISTPTANPVVGPTPQSIVCPSCRQQGQTVMRFESHSNTHRNALIMCLCCCWPCAFLPYCMDSCRNGNHYCSKCGAFIGTYSS